MDFSKDLNQELISFMNIKDLNNFKYTNRAIYKDSKEILDAMTFNYTGKIGINSMPDGPIHKEEPIKGKVFFTLEPTQNFFRDKYYKFILRLNNDVTKKYEFDIFLKKVIKIGKNKIYKLITYREDDTHITIGNHEGDLLQIAIVKKNYRNEYLKNINLFVVYKDVDASQKYYLKKFFELIEKIPDEQDF
jgi:hypothetical protein